MIDKKFFISSWVLNINNINHIKERKLNYMKYISKLFFTALLALPVIAKAEIALSNNTNIDLAVSVNDKCIIDKLPPHRGQIMNNYALTDACVPNTDDCSAKFFMNSTCAADGLIASYVFNVKDGFKSAESHNANYRAEIYAGFTAKVSEVN